MAKKKPTTITWTNERRKLADLIPWEHNPRTIKQKQAERLVDSVETFGQVETLAIGPGNALYNGHQRLSVLAGQYGMDYEVDVRVASRELTERERQQLTVYLHKGATGEFDFEALANTFDMDDLLTWGFEPFELGLDFDEEAAAETAKKEITRTGRLYNAGDGHDIEPYKLAHRIETIWQSADGLAIDLYSGRGQLAAWYKRRFKRVVTNDKNFAVGDVDHSMTAMQFIKTQLMQYIDFDYIDFDDEGSPGKEINLFFDTIKGVKKTQFTLALTDGNGLNLQMKGKFNPLDYCLDGEIRQATKEDYKRFEEYVTNMVTESAKRNGFMAEQLSSWHGRDGHVIFQTWRISINDAG